MDALNAACCVGVENPGDFREALKAVFMTRVEQSGAFDLLFRQFWMVAALESGVAGEPDTEAATHSEGSGFPQEGEDLFAAEAVVSESQEKQAWDAKPYVMYSPWEVLRDQDFKYVPENQDRNIAQLIREVLAPLLRRTGVRKRPVNSGMALDFRRLLRKNVRYGGEIYELPRLKPKRRIKKLVFLCDVSGSMNPYLRFMLRFIREIQQLPSKVETFVFATRLHRVTPFLVRLPFARALQEIARTVRDWSGGTRIGSCLQEFASFRSGGMLGSSTVVIIHSDGWDRGEADVLEREIIKIHRRCHRLIWINPLLGGPFYEPTCRGMKTALPYVDSFLPGHNIKALARIAGTLRGLL